MKSKKSFQIVKIYLEKKFRHQFHTILVSRKIKFKYSKNKEKISRNLHFFDKGFNYNDEINW